MDKKKIINIIEILFWIVAVILIVIVIKTIVIPKMDLKREEDIKENGRIFLERVLAKYDITKKAQYDIKKSVLDIIDDLNEERVNPYGKKNLPYVLNEECKGCITINIDEGTNSIVATGYDSKNNILTRSVINPPSYVSYEKPVK